MYLYAWQANLTLVYTDATRYGYVNNVMHPHVHEVREKILVGRATEHTISYVFQFVYKSAVAEMFK